MCWRCFPLSSVCCGKDINSLCTAVTRLSSKSKNWSIISLSKRSGRQVSEQEMHFGTAVCVFLPKSFAGRHLRALLSLWIWRWAVSHAKTLFETPCERSERPDWDTYVETGNESHLISTPRGVWFWFAQVTFHYIFFVVQTLSKSIWIESRYARGLICAGSLIIVAKMT